MIVRHPRTQPAGGDARTPSRRGERGAGLIGSLAGVSVFLVLLLFAVQITVHLYATSTLSAAGYDAARAVAGRAVDPDDASSVARAKKRGEARFRAVLGEAGRDARLIWQLGPDVVRLRVVVDSPSLLPGTVADEMGIGRIERTFVVRREVVR